MHVQEIEHNLYYSSVPISSMNAVHNNMVFVENYRKIIVRLIVVIRV
jgi:hypothetical protein